MPRMVGSGLSWREREILDVLHQKETATAAEVMEALAQPPSYSAVRALLRVLEDKGLVQHTQQDRRYLYRPIQARSSAARTALQNVVQTFFGGSLEGAVRAFLSDSEARVTDEELTSMAALIEQARASEGEPT